jgi:hypothetical protein
LHIVIDLLTIIKNSQIYSLVGSGRYYTLSKSQ